MTTQKAKTYSAEFKAKVAIDAIQGDLTLSQISSKYAVHSTQITRWKQQALNAMKEGFNSKLKKQDEFQNALVDKLYRQIGQLTCENDFLKKKVWQ